ncbi:hypothetical protein F5B22DRAFT_653020 [Xylaria bambusicola]|uniref:uncharacterized protein n=1 Tax=Xylaria bambusicola TaxID=326684 RepID=UPI0020072C30|nr:uncharacterized protein F5B22DRAFT_653020 [Xylaria bambusicola]KAI0527869.1 hypothetical protein F5B22DRAFT_653020 [Xylaria bambusicola]
MRVSSRAGARLTRYLKPTVRHISWMPFEQPDPSLYAQPPSLLPKRPISAEAVTNAESSPTPQTIVIGKIGTTSTAQAQEDPVSGKPVPTALPASAMRTGPTPLSQVQKRTYSTSAAPKEPNEPANKDENQAKSTSDSKE